MNEQEIYDKYGSQEYRSRVQRECAAFNCPTWVSHPGDDFCIQHKPRRGSNMDPPYRDPTDRELAEREPIEPDTVDTDGHPLVELNED